MPGDQHDENDVERAANDETRDERREYEFRDEEVEQILEDAGAFFVAEDEDDERGPTTDADAPPPG